MSSSEVTQYEPNRKYEFKNTSGHVQGKWDCSFESTAGGTNVAMIAEAEMGGFFKLVEPLVKGIMRR